MITKIAEKHELVICFGSSCFARGNKEIVAMIRDFLETYGLSRKVNFRGKHCFGHCENGPNLKIDDRHFDHISRENIEEILSEVLLK